MDGGGLPRTVHGSNADELLKLLTLLRISAHDGFSTKTKLYFYIYTCSTYPRLKLRIWEGYSIFFYIFNNNSDLYTITEIVFLDQKHVLPTH